MILFISFSKKNKTIKIKVMKKCLVNPLVNTLLIKPYMSKFNSLLIEYLLLVVATGIEPIL